MTKLYAKYKVIKNSTNEEVDGCFVLRPKNDPAAFKALVIYAQEADDEELANDLLFWLAEIVDRKQQD